MKTIKIIILSTAITLLSFVPYSFSTERDCSNPIKLHEKLMCKMTGSSASNKSETKSETKPDCSQYSTKTLEGLSNKMRCKKGLPPRKNFFGSIKVESKSMSTNDDNVQEKKTDCSEHSTKTLTGLMGKIRCKK